MTPLEAALAYIKAGWNPTPVKPRSKAPVFTDWPNRIIGEAEAPQYFHDPRLNVGIVLGPTSNGLADVDLDCLEAVAAAPYLLPATPGLFGRPSNRDSHWLYRSDLANDPAIDKAVVKFDDPSEPNKKKAKLIELRIGGAAGAQTVFPPSTHESGEAIDWSNGKDPDPPAIPGPDLLTKARRLAAAALLGRHWPQRQGTGGHNAARLIGGLLRRAGFGDSDIALFVEATCRAGVDPDIKDRVRTARDAAEAFDRGVATQGLPTLEKTFGKEIADRLADWLDLKPGAASRPTAAVAAGPKPVIRLGPFFTATAAEAEQAILAARLPVFSRDTLLVRPVIVVDRTTRTGKLIPVSVPLMRSFMDQAADFEKFDSRAKDYVPTKPPADIAELILERADEWPFPPVSGILMAPSMRPDGSLILAPGYDSATGLYLIDPPLLPAIPNRPTRQQAEVAIELLMELLREFPLVDPEDIAVGLSALITPIVRPALGQVPMHIVTSPDIGSGKSYLTHCCSVLATGFRPSAITAGKDEAETEKRLGSALIAGSPIILLDNVSSTLKGDFLCTAIEQPRVKIRLLGHSRDIEVETRSTIFVTGNNLQVSGDVVRRGITGTLNPGVENAYERSFDTKPLAMITADRGKYIAAALTICRAFRQSGAAPVQPPLASFEEWSDIVRSAIVWLGKGDPVKTIATLRENDPEREGFAQVIECWETTWGLAIGVTAAEAVDEANSRTLNNATGVLELKRPELHRALMAVAKEYKGSNLSVHRFGNWLRTHRNRIMSGRVFRRGDKTSSGFLWSLEAV